MKGQNAKPALVPPFASIYTQIPVAADAPASLPCRTAAGSGTLRRISRLARYGFFRNASALAAIAVNVEADEFRMRSDIRELHLRAACRAVRWIDAALWIACGERESRRHQDGCLPAVCPENA